MPARVPRRVQHLPRQASQLNRIGFLQPVTCRRSLEHAPKAFAALCHILHGGSRHTRLLENLERKRAAPLDHLLERIKPARIIGMSPDLCAAEVHDPARETEVVGMGMRNDDTLEIRQREAPRGNLMLQYAERLFRARTGIDERQEVALDQIDIDRADGHMRRKGELVDRHRLSGPPLRACP